MANGNREEELLRKAEAEMNKPDTSLRSAFLGCGTCDIVYSESNSLFILSSPTATPVSLSGASINLQGWTVYLELAKFGNKIWTVGRKTGQKAIIELTLNSNCDGVTLSKIMPLH
mgnify:FL=1